MHDRILVVGGGIAGLSTAWTLARRGARDVVVVEAGARLGAQATAQNAAILRTPMVDLVGEALGREGGAFLRSPPRGFADAPLLDPCGLLLLAERDSEGARAWAQRLARHADAGVVELDAQAVRARAPHVRAEGTRCFLIPREGRIDVPGLVRGYERGARAAGVRFVLRARVRELLADARGARLEDGRVLEADRVVLAAGAWAEDLARAAGSRVTLHPTRRHLVVTRASRAVDPTWPVVWRDDHPFYARPEAGGLMLSACDEEPVDAKTLTVDVRELEKARALARHHLRIDDPLEAARFWAGIRTHSADTRFLIGADPDVANLVWVGALGGHGITCAAPVGEIAADWVIDGRSAHALARDLDPRRFATRAAGQDARAVNSGAR